MLNSVVHLLYCLRIKIPNHNGNTGKRRIIMPIQKDLS